MNIQVLKTEIITDPLTRGYAGMSNAAVATDLNTIYRTLPVESVTSADIFEAIDRLEFAALAAAQQARIDRILGLGDGIKVGSSQARSELLDIFGAGTTTRTNLATLATRPASRADELGLGRVKTGHVQMARSA